MKLKPLRLAWKLAVIAAIVAIGFWLRGNYGRIMGEPAAEQLATPGGASDLVKQPAAAAPKPPVGPASRPGLPGIASTASAPARPTPPATLPAPAASMPTTRLSDPSKAAELLAAGQKALAEGKLIQARQNLADALNSALLDQAQAATARQRLLELADKTIFCREVIPDDPCTFYYRFKPGDMLVKVELEQKLHVPTQLFQAINKLDPTRIQAGQSIKLIRGPFHAIVSKGIFRADVYLAEPDTGRLVLVREFRVGLGKNGSTPTGKWRLALGGKIRQSPWAPPTSSDTPHRVVRWGESGYPLGKEGYWISLEGIEGNALTAADGYGIHGTNEPDSIGKASSLGCIRLADADIEALFSTLYEFWSTVTIQP